MLRVQGKKTIALVVGLVVGVIGWAGGLQAAEEQKEAPPGAPGRSSQNLRRGFIISLPPIGT